jgi:hypothetical protein
MILSTIICLISFIWLIVLLRRDQISVGVPVAYLFALLFIHVPGAVAHIYGEGFLADTEDTVIGIRYTAIGSVCFVVGVWASRRFTKVGIPHYVLWETHRFALFCLVLGLMTNYTLRVLFVQVPSIAAVVEKGGGIWVLGVLLGLQSALAKANIRAAMVWLAAMFIFPVLTLLLGGFLSFGSTPIFLILAALVISTHSAKRIAIAVPVVAFLFFSLFLSYFQNRDNIRGAVWGRAAMSERVDESLNIFRDIELFDPENVAHLQALDVRLNQNYFVGRSALRIEEGQVNFLYGKSFWEGLIALVPRFIWPSKPVFGGSPEVIMNMTGFIVNDTTSYGVGNVMEFYINFGIPSLVGGFLLLGGLLGWLDRRAALAIRAGNFPASLLFFTPAAAMVNPGGSLVELTGGGASAFIAALGWRKLWGAYSGKAGGGVPGGTERFAAPALTLKGKGGTGESTKNLPAA